MMKKQAAKMKFKVGNTVTWTSHGGGGGSKTKTGRIVAAVPPGGNPDEYVPGRIGGLKPHLMFTLNDRDHKSFLVAVMRDHESSLVDVYWPRVSQLRPA